MPGTDFYGAVEATSAAIIPLAGGLVAAVRWRKSAQQSRVAREEAARIAGERAAQDARAEVQQEKARTDAVNTLLLAEKDRQITQLQADLTAERKENADKDTIIRDLMRGTGGAKT